MNPERLQLFLMETKLSEASDLLLSAGSPPQIRVNGILRPLKSDELTAEDLWEFLQRLLNDNEMRAFNEQQSIDFSRAFEEIGRFRFNIYMQRRTPTLAARLLPDEIPGFSELGLPPIVREFCEQPHGLFLVTGPAGSGKSTTLASMIDYINHRSHAHIITLEDPIEYVHQHVTCVVDQREIGQDAPSFTSALRNIFRQSPDVIMVGEMRDLETIALALTLAETGHLILATLHTRDTTHAVSRIVDVFPSDQQQQIYFQLSQVLVGVMAQQLIQTVDSSRQVLACEVLKVNNAIRNLIRESKMEQIYSVIQSGRSEGMITMNESLQELLNLELIHEQTALRRTGKPKELLKLIEHRSSKGGKK